MPSVIITLILLAIIIILILLLTILFLIILISTAADQPLLFQEANVDRVFDVGASFAFD